MPKRLRHAMIAAGLVAAAVLTPLFLFTAGRPGERWSDEAVRLLNRGKAHLENRESAAAIEVLGRARALQPHSSAVLRNLARAYLIAQKPEAAFDLLQGVQATQPDSATTRYLLGLTLNRLSKPAEAVAHFEQAVRLDPVTAALRFQLAGAYDATDQADKAKAQYLETIRLDPLHASSYYKLANAARRNGDTAEHQRLMGEFNRLRQLFSDDTRSAEVLETCLHTKPEAAPSSVNEAASRQPAATVTWTDVTDSAFAAPDDREAALMVVLEVDEQGRITLVTYSSGPTDQLRVFQTTAWPASGADPAGPWLKRMNAQSFGGRGFTHLIAGDFHDDVPDGEKYDFSRHARADLLLIGPDAGCLLLKQTEALHFDEVTDSAGLSGVFGDRAAWVDYEHDGDLDLVVAAADGLHLYQNNGNATFTSVGAAVGITLPGPVADVAAGELDGNVAVDLVAAGTAQPSRVFLNQRAGRFAEMTEPPGPWPAARRVLVDDLDNDGRPDVVLVGEKGAGIRYSRAPDREAARTTAIPGHAELSFGDLQATGGLLFDFDNDGWLDLLAYGRSDRGKPTLVLWHQEPSGEWRDATLTTGLNGALDGPARATLAADFDADGDSDLLLMDDSERLQALRNDGGNGRRQFKLRLAPVKTNPSGFGTQVEMRDAGNMVSRYVTGAPIEIGVGGAEKLDTVLTVWTNGVVDNQFDVTASARPLTVVEKNVATGSCPFLYVWDGQCFRFVTDLLGNAPLGLPLARDVLLPADPDEYVLIGPAEIFPASRGPSVAPSLLRSASAASLFAQITSEFREVLYLDDVQLVAVDHDPEVEIHSTDKLRPEPFPPSELWALAQVTPPTRVESSDGLDRTVALQSVDGAFADAGLPLPPPVRGMCHPLSLTLTFNVPAPSTPSDLVLALTGWLQYGDGSTNIHLSQNPALTLIPPRLEMETAPGAWQEIDVTVGMPAGKTKTILVDLGAAPWTRGASVRLRLTTTFEIRWDRLALARRVPLDDTHVHRLEPAVAELQWRGFSELRARAAGHPTTPDHDVVSDRPPWRTAVQGWCTRYGDVLELVRERDERLVILNGGDALTLAFDAAPLPPCPEGLVRTFAFYSVGWDKDADPNNVDGDTVEPLPVHAALWHEPNDELPWSLRYTTRFVPAEIP